MSTQITDYNVSVIKYPNTRNGNVVSIELFVEQWPKSSGTMEKRESRTYIQEKTFKRKRSESLYLGGAPNNDVYKLTGHLYTNTFNGCISHLKITKKTHITFFTDFDFKSGKGVLKRERVSCEKTCIA